MTVTSARRSEAGAGERVIGYLEAALDCVVMADASGRVVEFNPAAERTFGYSRAEALGRTLAELIVPPSLQQQHTTAFARFVETRQAHIIGRRIEMTARRADGTEFPVELALSVVETEPPLICGALRDLSAAKRAEDDLRKFADVHAALHRVATIVAELASPAEVFAAVAEEVRRIFDLPLIEMSRFEPDGTVCVIGASGEHAFQPGTRWPLEGQNVAALVKETGRSTTVAYADLVGTIAESRRAAGFDTGLGIPIVVDGVPWGVLVTVASAQKPFPPDTEARLADFTELVATAISNAETRRELEGVAAEQHALRTAATLVASGASPTEVFGAITASASEVFGVPFASLIRVGAAETATMVAGCAACSVYVGTTWTIPADDPGIARTVLKSRRPSRVDDHSRVRGPIGEAARALGVGSVVGAPVIVDGAVWGVLVVGAAVDGPPLPADAGDRLVGFTELVSTAIGNSEAQERVRRLLDEQAALRRVATLVAAEVEPDELFAAVSDEIAQLFASDGAAVARFEPDGSRLVAAGVSKVLQSVPVGARIDLDESLASTVVHRTGRGARKHIRGEDVRAAGPIGDMLRGLGGFFTVAAPIKVAGTLWGTIITFSERASLPADTEERLEKFGELVATAIANAEGRNDLAAAEARARALAEEQAALRRVATLVAHGVSAEELFVAVCDEVAGLVGAEITTIGRFDRDEPHDITVVGLSSGFLGVSTGTRAPQMDWLASSVVFRTGRTARKDVTAAEINDSHPVADSVRALGFFSTVSAPIVVEGELWGVVTASSSQASLPPNAEKRVESFGELVATAIANADSRAALADSEAHARALADEQSALRRVATLVAQSPASEELFSAVAREVASVLRVPGVIVTRYDPDGTVVTLGEAFNSDLAGGERFFGVGSRSPRDPGSLAAQVFDTHRPARIDDFSTLQGTIGDAARAARLGCGCAGPIVVNGDLWGKMCVFSGPGTTLPAGTENRLNEFIELVATAIANYEARADLAASESHALELANEQAALRRIATLVAESAAPQDVFDAVRREVAEVFDVPFTVLWRFDPDGLATVLSADRGYLGPAGTRWPIEGDTSIAARVRETGRAARVDFTAPGHSPGSIADAARRAGVRSGVGVPIVVEGELWGSMTVGSEKIEPLPAELERRLERFTELLATAIANAESRDEVTQLAAEQAALRRVATLVAQGAEPRHVFAAVAEEVAGVVDIPIIRVNRFEHDGTFTMVGIAGETNFTVGSRWPVPEDGVGGMILSTGRPARKDDYSTVRGPLGDALREDQTTATVGVPIVVDGTIWGFIVAAARPGGPIPTDTEERLARFTELVATAVSNATTRTDLLTSRARLVSTADETRRRLERDLHDGIQQWLVALALKARKAAGLSAAGEPAAQELSGLADDLVAVTDELREISRGIHPAILSDSGLDDALRALARRSAIRVDLDVSFERRFDPTLEATVYYVVAESITNAVKHGQAPAVAVRGRLREGTIELEIEDDGVGGADPRRGTGLIGLKDRVDTLGGTISFASPAGAGTTIRVKLPAAPASG